MGETALLPRPTVAVTPATRSWAWLWATPAGGALGVAVWWLMGSAMSDDAHITAGYARSLAFTGQWGMLDLPSNTATSPLSVLLLAGITVVVRDAIAANGVLLAICLAACGAALHRVGGSWLAALGLGFLASSPLLVSTVGLESYLAVTLMLVAVAVVKARQPWWAGVVVGLLVLCRPDLAVVAVIVVALSGRGWWRAAVTAVAVTVPWFVWSWWQLGSLVPDTFLMKAGGGGWGGVPFPLWFVYYSLASWGAVTLALIPAAAGLLVLPWWLRTVEGWVLGVGGLAHYAAMTEVAAGLHFWYAAPAFGGLGLLACCALARRRWATIASGGFVVVCVASLLNNGLPPAYTPIHNNWGASSQYRAFVDTVPPGAYTAPGEVGVLAYYGLPRGVRVLDGFDDPGYITELIDRKRAAAPRWEQTLLDWNYRNRLRSSPAPVNGHIVADISRDAGEAPTIVDKAGGGRTLRVTR